jgi:hypothetical protein
VILASDKPKGRLRRRGQHTRTPEEQACLDAFAAFLRYDAPSAGRSLSRLATTVLASRLLPAARALADAVDVVLAEQPLAAPLAYDAAVCDAPARDSPARDSPARDSPARGLPAPARPARGAGPPGARTVALNFTVSPAFLLGVCRDGGCRSPLCEHACHSRPA